MTDLAPELGLKAGERSAERRAHLRANEEHVGRAREQARVAQRVRELLAAAGPVGHRLEDGEELALGLGIGELDPVPDARLVLHDPLGDLTPSSASRAPAERPTRLGI